MNMIIKELAECNEDELEQLILLDNEAVFRYGKSFSEEIWTKTNFIYKLPFKESKSLVVFDDNMKPLGFCIISLKNNSDSYIHRFVSKNSNENKASKLLMDEVLKRNQNIHLVVATHNETAINFYRKYGFEIEYNSKKQKIIFPKESPLLSNGFIHEDYKFLMSRIKSKKILCNISGFELPQELNNDMQLVQTYTSFLEVFDEIHFVCRSITLNNSTIKHQTKSIFVHHVKVSNTIFGKTIGAIWKLYFVASEKSKIHGIDYFIASDTTIGGPVCSLLAILKKKRYILEVQAEMTKISPKVVGWWKAKTFKFITLLAAKAAFKVRAVSKTVGQQLIEDGVSPNKLRVVTSRVKLDKFNYLNYKDAPQEIRKKYKIQDDEQLFVFVGRLVVFKGLIFLIRALVNFNLIPYKLLIVGDGELRPELEHEVIKLGLQDKIIFHGSVDFSEVPYFMACADLMIMPSTDEGFPRVMLEAMAMKKLVVGSMVGGVKDIAVDGENGYFFPSQNPEEITKALTRVYNDNKKDYCIEKAYNLVKEKYEFSVAMKDYTNLLKEMIV
jgi:glycosyltransferase involved in cell wall biosynthesis